ncbi:hypothetical protein [Arthrobacter sp. 35W]|uniref:hypothetical protein n=1 Tax=Arthrobacter sp. 35W TaxID=1132441 RepID=UPI0004223617|nr:hypothetical protein [Arthrobacter sp. 35W]
MSRPTTEASASPIRRRGLLAGAGAAGFGVLAGLAAAPAARAQDSATGALPVLSPGDDWAATLAATPQVQLVAGAAYTLEAAVDLPHNTLIEGNGAIVTVAGDGIGAFTATSKIGITLRGITFQGRTADPLNAAANFAHTAVRLVRCTDFRVLDCDFNFWLGAGVAVTGSTSDDYFSYRGHVEGNNFHSCYFGVSFTDRAEYCLLANNIFSTNRLAIWNSSGNLTTTSNVAVNCYGAYYAYAKTSPYGAQSSDNWNHGAVVGNTFNHSNGSGGPRWTSNAAFPIGGASTDPGSGVVVDGLLPPTFTGNTLWYTNIKANNHGANVWMLTGNALSNLSITANGTNPIKLLGYQSNGAANVPTLVGNVQSVF